MAKLDDHPKADCKGCRSYLSKCNCACGVDFQRNEEICPCSTCLVKRICISGCEDWNAYSYIFCTIQSNGGMKPNDKCKRA